MRILGEIISWILALVLIILYWAIALAIGIACLTVPVIVGGVVLRLMGVIS